MTREVRVAVLVIMLALFGVVLIVFQSRAETGHASWYQTGTRTANGERFRPEDMTCAHKVLPFGTIVRVTRLDNGRAIRCRINDRGPFIRGRIIDLSRKAAQGLGIISAGTTKVRVEVLK